MSRRVLHLLRKLNPKGLAFFRLARRKLADFEAVLASHEGDVIDLGNEADGYLLSFPLALLNKTYHSHFRRYSFGLCGRSRSPRGQCPLVAELRHNIRLGFDKFTAVISEVSFVQQYLPI